LSSYLARIESDPQVTPLFLCEYLTGRLAVRQNAAAVMSVLVTGVSRRIGIAWSIAEHLHTAGWAVDATGWPAHDAEQPWGADAAPSPAGVRWEAADLEAPDAAERLVAAHVARHGGLHALVAAHARSASGGLGALTAAELDRSYAVNARATLLLVQAAARAGVRRVVLFTTGVHHEAMADELAYATSKAALQGITRSLAQALAPHGATINCINPGPVDTGYADDATRAAVAARMPMKRWGTPRDIAPVVAWLLSDDAAWITGQILDVDGGWSLRRATT
jgi:3-oxoacyl-[acyl-carrier protein] reductase